MTKKTRKNYSKEFKLEAVRLADSSARPVAQIEQELGITAGLLRKWRLAHQQEGGQAFPGKGKVAEAPEVDRLRSLERELKRVKQEHDILKKVVGIFSQPER